MKLKLKANRYIFILLAFLAPFLIMGIALILHKCFPFGDQQFLIVDLWHQYFPFLSELHEKMTHGSSLLYSWDIGMGTNFLGLLSYYAASPLNLVLVFVPSDYLVVGLEVLVLIRMGLASSFSALFLKNVFKRNDFSLVIFGSVYGLSGFFLGYYWNVMWLDTVALLPLVALGIHKIMEKRDFRLYVITLALSLFSNYYIGLFTCIFTGLYYFGVCLYQKCSLKELLKGVGSMLLYSAVGIGLSAVLLLPAYLCLQNTYYASSSFPEKINFFYSLPELIQNLFAFQKPSYVEGAPNLYSGLLPLLFAAVFFSNRRIPLREKIYYGIFLVFLLLSCNMNILDFIWHGFHYTNMVPHRFAFLFTFLVMVIGYRGWMVWRKSDLFDILSMSFICILLLSLGFLQLERKIWLANLILVGILLILSFLFKRRILHLKSFFAILSMVLLVEYILGAYISVDTGGTTQFSSYPLDNEAVEALVSEVEEQEAESSEFFRLEFGAPYTLNDAALYHTHGITCFSSMCNAHLSYVLEKLGLAADDGSNRYAYHLTSPMTASFFNIKYLINRDGAFESDTWTRRSSETNLIRYDNNYELPLGFMTEAKILDTDIDQLNPFTIQNEMFSFATGIEADIFTEIPRTDSDLEHVISTAYEDESYYLESLDEDKDGTCRFSFDVEEGQEIFAYMTSAVEKAVSVYGSGYTATINVDYPYIAYLRKGVQDDQRTFFYDVKAGESGDIALYVRAFQTDVFEKGYERLANEPLTVTKYTDTSVEGKVSVKEDGYLFTSIPYEKGWTLYVDGKKTEIEPFKEAFIGAMLEKGEHEIKLTYLPQGFVIGCVITGVSFAAFVALWLFYKKKGRNAENE